MRSIQIQGRNGLIRDIDTKAILSTSTAECGRVLSARAQNKQLRETIKSQAEAINTLQAQMKDIQELLRNR